MTPRYRHVEIGKRLIGYAPFGHWKTTTFPFTALRQRLASSMERSSQLTSNKKVGTLSPGDIVIMDNLSAHKRAAVKIAIEAAGAELSLPTAPIIEQAFAKFKEKQSCANSPDGRSKACGAPAPSQPRR